MNSHSDGSVSPPSFTEPVPSIGNTSSDPPSLPNDSSSGTTSHGPYEVQEVKNITQILCEKRWEVQAQDKSGHGLSINMLPDNVLLEIFDSCRKDHDPNELPYSPVWIWHRLVHVCQRWRQIIFGSPRRLDLQILCTYGALVGNLDCWPLFPIAIHYPHYDMVTPDDKEGLLILLEHPGRIRQINLCLAGSQIDEVTTVMQEPFPALTDLILRWEDQRPSQLPDGFLGRSAPCLQFMHLEDISFPAFPTLLSSTSDLGTLYLSDICEDSFIAPEVMVACLAALPRLKFLYIEFQPGVSGPDRILPPPITRTLLPALTSFEFRGDSGYLEELVSRIDCPQLEKISIGYSCPRFDFQVAPLFKFIDRSEVPEMTLIRHADILLSEQLFMFNMYPRLENCPDRGRVSASISVYWIERQFSRVAQEFSQPFAMFSRVVHLKLSGNVPDAHRHGIQWLLFLRQFSTVRTIHVSREISQHIALALEDVTGEMVADVLPVLDLIYFIDQPATSVEKFLTVRRLSGHPVTIVGTKEEFDEKVNSYVSE